MRVLVVLACLVVALCLAEEEIVATQKGKIEGQKVKEKSGLQYYAFKGIPFAKPPVHELRFRDPVEVDDYEDVLDATEFRNHCPQWDIGETQPIGDEDCLNLNIFTPAPDSKKRPVFVYIHGGAFIMGGVASRHLGPQPLMEQDVVLVTLNYRIGALGFLATEDNASSGNMGIKDQIMALKWIRDNIEAFGGDPSKVTLIGDDAGAVSVSIHALSPESKGLFHNAIAISGTVLCHHFIQRNPQDSATELATRLQCSTESGEDIVDCLQRKSQQDIVKAENRMKTFFSFPRWFVPSIDGKVLPDDPEKLLDEGKINKVPFLIGETKDEGAAFYRLLLNTFGSGGYNDNFLDYKLPRILPVISEFKTKLFSITRQVRKRYFYNTDMDNEDEFRPKFVEFLTDLLFSRCVSNFASKLAKNNVETYQYVYDYRGQYSIANLQGEQVDMGVIHGDDMQYIFQGIFGEDKSASTSDKKFSNKTWLPLLVNFAKTGKPIPTVTDVLNVAWNPLSSDKRPVMRINKKLSVDEEYKKEILEFWKEDIPKLLAKKKKSTAKTEGKDEL